jgi:hypothetical protein
LDLSDRAFQPMGSADGRHRRHLQWRDLQLPRLARRARARTGRQTLWRDLWAYREAFAIIAWRDDAVRYKQTVIGIAWAVVRPFLMMVVFAVVLGRLARFPGRGGAAIPSWCLSRSP